MGAVNETVKTVNSTLRTIIAAVFVGGAGYAGYQGYAIFNEPKQQLAAKEKELAEMRLEYETMQAAVAEKDAEIERLDAANNLLKIDQRVAELKVVDQKKNDAGDTLTSVEFIETSPDGIRIGEPKRFDIPGDRIYVEYLVVKFNDALVEQADVERGTAIALFQRIFGNQQEADEGFTIDQPGAQPNGYARGGAPSKFEQQFWDNFWELAHDREKLESLGVRALQGNAPFFQVRPGETYRLWLRTSGDFTMSPVTEPLQGPVN